MLNQLWLDSPYNQRIIIRSHSLDVSNSGEKHREVFRNTRTGNNDGVHHYGKFVYLILIEAMTVVDLASQPCLDLAFTLPNPLLDLAMNLP